MIEFIKLLIVGIVQGISEVLPISSSAHLILVQNLLGLKDNNLTLEIFLHLASFVAVVFYLRKRLIKLIIGTIKYLFKRNKDYILEYNIFKCMIVSTIPVIIFSVLIKNALDSLSGNIFVIGALLMINGLLILLFMKRKGEKGLSKFTLEDAFVVGLCQCLGIFPGISRSGSCLVGTSIRGLNKDASSEYAFLLFIPAVLGAFILEFKNISQIMANEKLWIYLVVFIVTSITTYLSFCLFLRIIKKDKLKYFGYYSLLVGWLSMIFC